MARISPHCSGSLHSRKFPPHTQWAPKRPSGSTSRACRPRRQFGLRASETCPEHIRSTPGPLHSRTFPPHTQWAPRRPSGSTSRAYRPRRQFGLRTLETCPEHIRSTPAAWTRCQRFRERRPWVASTSLGRTSQDRSRGTLCPTWHSDLGCMSRQGTLFPPQIPQDRRCRLGTVWG